MSFLAIFVIPIGALSPSHFFLATRVTDFAAERCECQAGGSDCALVSRRPPPSPLKSCSDAEPMSPGKIGENKGAKFLCHTGWLFISNAAIAVAVK